MDSHRRLISQLTQSAESPLHGENLKVIETHISTVVLTDNEAYKFKKPVNFGFLDFSTLAARKHCCEEEIRLNQRLAPSLYLETVAITGPAEAPQINGNEPALEYAVRMRRFDQEQLLDNLLRQGQLDGSLIDAIAERIALFHASAAVASADSDFARPETIFAPMQQNFEQLRELITDLNQIAQLNRIEDWTQQQFEILRPALEARGAGGFVRECHGDMHLGNITLYEGEVAIFDGIEFNEHFRWIDVMSEMAFLTMDLTDRGAEKLAMRLLNRYLEQTGDYAGVSLLRFYQVYRAMVRAKIASFRLADPNLSDADRTQTLAQFQSYADLAERFAQIVVPRLALMYGVSGSGKSWLSSQLLEALPAIRLRSDVERKRLFGSAGGETTAAAIGAGIYSADASAQTYAHLCTLAAELLKAQWQVIVDAAFLQATQREPFHALADDLAVKCVVVATVCDQATLRQRLASRRNDVSDADVNIMLHQLKIEEFPRADENLSVVDCDHELDLADLVDRIQF